MAMTRPFARLVFGTALLASSQFVAAAEPAVEETAVAKVEVAADDSAEDDESTGEEPTHKQSALININAEGLPEASVQSFCLLGDDRLLAGCTGPTNEIRVFDGKGAYVEAFKLPVAPEAINMAPDGTILVAGDGELLRLSAEGKVLAKAESPHAAAIRDAKEEVRKQTLEQHKQQAEMLPQMLEAYDSAMKELEKQIAQLEEQGEEGKEQLQASKDMMKSYEQAKEQMKEQYGDNAKELTDEQVEEMVKSAIQYKLKVASISSDGEAVFVACGMPAGYGYAVWKLTPDFADGKQIVSGLSGCCGQMDVQANADGIFVAENSRKRVRRFDAEGETVCDWGKSSEGIDGFGSCCNPMNLAFGTNGSVYTAEDTTGRIKRYSNDGKLLSVVGAADVVPGCKKVSIGVDSTGDRVYMLDITRNNVAVLSRVNPDPKEPLANATSSSGNILLQLIGLE